MVRIGVFADTHIGRGIPKEIGGLRRRAHRHAFTQAVNIFIDRGVDCVIHAGDLFERRSMSSEDSVFVKEELQRLVDSVNDKHGKEVSIFMVRGNHDGVFEDNNALDFVKHPLAKYLRVMGDSVLKGEEEAYSHGDLLITGVPYHPNMVNVFKTVKPVVKKCFEKRIGTGILVLHCFLDGLHEIPPGTPRHSYLTLSDFEDLNVKIVVAGHYHERTSPLMRNGILFLTPGATEAVDLSDEGPFGVYILEEAGKAEFIRINPLHDIRSVRVDSKGSFKTSEWFVEKALSEIVSYSRELDSRGVEGVLRLVLSGNVEGDPGKIDVALENWLRKTGFSNRLLHVHLVNEVEEVLPKMSLKPFEDGARFTRRMLEEVFGGSSGEAAKIVEEVETALEEKASQKTGLLTDSDRAVFVRRWIQLLEKTGR